MLTGRCKKIEEDSETECKEGYYRNPETGRCKKKEAEKTPAECAEGYERNPDTNRCRKIRSSASLDYAPEDVVLTPETYNNPEVFVGAIALLIFAILAVLYTIFQFRQEISRPFRRIVQIIKTRKQGP